MLDEHGYGSRCQVHWFVSRTAMLDFSRSTASRTGLFTLNSFPCVSRMVQHPKNIHPTSHNCRKHCSQHGPASLWNAFETLRSPCPNELRLYLGQKRDATQYQEGVLNVMYTQNTI